MKKVIRWLRNDKTELKRKRVSELMRITYW